MRIGIVISFMNGFGEKGQYHSQELGLAKQLAKEGHSVEVYKAVGGGEAYSEAIGDSVIVRYIPSRHFGAQGLMDVSAFSVNLDALVYFSDTQISLNAIDAWCSRNGVRPFYYVGAIESTSDSGFKKALMDLHYRLRTLPVYRRRGAVAKTPFVRARLQDQGVSRVDLAPVGIDFALMDAAPGDGGVNAAGLCGDMDRILLFVGKLERYKHPQKALELLCMLPSTYGLIVVGKGSMASELRDLAIKLGLDDRISWVPSVLNSQMTAYYSLADFFVNVNPSEIFGMAVVEAVYHGCRTFALSAPGPDYILDGMRCHEAVDTIKEMAARITAPTNCGPDDIMVDRKKLIERCSWHAFADLIENELSERGAAS